MIKTYCILFALLTAGTFSTSFGQFGFMYKDSIIVKNGSDTLELAWGGGLNYAQFSDIDFDFDGDMDLFVFDRSQDNIRVYTQEDQGNGKFYKLSYNAQDKFPSDLRYRTLLVDYDNDGRNDIFTYGIGGLKVYRNIGDAVNGPQWELFQDLVYTEYPGGNFNLYVSSSDIPAIVDIDGDGDIDVLAFHQGGSHVEYHQNQSMELYGIPDSLVFELKNECWGKFSEDVATNAINLNDPNAPCVGGSIPSPESEDVQNRNSPKHSGSTLLALDYDNSGVMDLIIGDVSYTNLNLLINGGTAVNTDSPMISVDPNFPSTSTPVVMQLFPAAFYVDVDFDGIRDLIVCPNAKNVSSNKNSVLFYKNMGTNSNPNFFFSTNSFLQNEMIEHGTGSIPVICDLDEDGLDDLFVANFYQYKPVLDKESTIAYYKNTGTLSTPEFTLIDNDFLNLSTEAYGLRSVPCFGDLDDDGDDDLLLGTENGTLVYYENFSVGAGAVFGPGILGYQDNAGNPINSGGYAHPQLFDLDADGLLDLIIGTKSGEIMYYQNIGAVNSPSFILYNPTLGEVDVSILGPDGYAAPHFFTDNGETHLFMGSVDGELIYYKNIENNLDPGQFFTLVSSSYINIDVEGYSSYWINDIDNDGELNMFVGQDLGGLYHFEVDTNSSISILELEIDPVISIYPNPTNDLISISSEHNLDHYNMFDMRGQMILESSMEGHDSTIDLRKLPQGLYFIQIILKDGRSVTKKLVKN